MYLCLYTYIYRVHPPYDIGAMGVVFVVWVRVGVGGVVFCRCVCVCDLLIFSHRWNGPTTGSTSLLAHGEMAEFYAGMCDVPAPLYVPSHVWRPPTSGLGLTFRLIRRR